MKDGRTPKILYAASTDGHLRSFHLPYLRELARRGYAVTAAAAGDGRGLPEGVGFVSVPFTKRFTAADNLRAAAALARLHRREGFDVIAVHTSLAAFFTRLGLLFSGKRGARVVNTVHGYLFDGKTPFPRRSALLLAEKLTARVTDDILVMNRADEAIARKHRLCRGRVVFVDGMGVDLRGFVPASPEERRAAREALGIPEEAFTLVCAAEFSPRKNQALLLRALARLPGDVFLLLPGRGALLEECRSLARELGVTDRVRFPGQAEDVLPFLRAADACVSASRSEGLPFHVMEAMACGLPAVLSDVKGHADLLAGEPSGIAYPFGDAEDLARAAEALRADASLRASLGAAARRKAERYALPRVMETVLPWYEPRS